MIILGIETSCDETAASVVQNGTKILSNVVHSQIDLHAAYGGVVPEIAARSHIETILPVIHEALRKASGFAHLDEVQGKSEQRNEPYSGIRRVSSGRLDDEIRQMSKAYDAIAVTHTPGLNGSLLIGTLTARTLALLTGKPLYPTHHIKSHIYANWLEDDSGRGKLGSSDNMFQGNWLEKNLEGGNPGTLKTWPDGLPAFCNSKNQKLAKPDAENLCQDYSLPSFPLIALVISGGHTQLIYMKSHNNFEIIGTTLDDAVGEAFDKVAKILGLPYPGGPSIAAAASKANGHQQGILNSREKTPAGGSFPGEESCLTDAHSPYSLPIPKVAGLDFSFSGLKTATLRAVQKAVGVPISTPSTELAALLTDDQRHNFAASFQATAIQILLEKLALAVQTYHPNSIVLGGGVSANLELRKTLQAKIADLCYSGGCRREAGSASISSRTAATAPRKDGRARERAPDSKESEFLPKLYFPEPKFCGDNAAMVASAAYFAIKAGEKPTDPLILDISPHSTIS